jgi:hypothetical protein|tara:strand:- start:721 stop:1620 length:900 start_codon:yes stop_codon:yes gene_type:complete
VAKKMIFIQYNPDDMVNGCFLLSGKAELVYRRICDLIYLSNNNLFDEEVTWSKLTEKFDWDFKEIKQELIKKNKIYIDSDIIRNNGCDKAIEKANYNHEVAKIKGQKGALVKKSLITSSATSSAISSATSSALAGGKQTINYKLLTINYNNISSSWNEIIPTSHIKEFTPTRKILMKKRFKQYFNEDYEEWNKFLRRIAKIPFLWGENDRGWKADFNWVLNENNYTKIVEGNYEKDTKELADRKKYDPVERVRVWKTVCDKPTPFMLSQAEKSFQEISDLYKMKLLTKEQLDILQVKAY